MEYKRHRKCCVVFCCLMWAKNDTHDEQPTENPSKPRMHSLNSVWFEVTLSFGIRWLKYSFAYMMSNNFAVNFMPKLLKHDHRKHWLKKSVWHTVNAVEHNTNLRVLNLLPFFLVCVKVSRSSSSSVGYCSTNALCLWWIILINLNIVSCSLLLLRQFLMDLENGQNDTNGYHWTKIVVTFIFFLVVLHSNINST